MKFTYTTNGVCSRSIEIEIDDSNIIKNVTFFGGCHGNLQGISALVKGKSVDEVINTLKDIKCGFKNTSCPAQLAKALIKIKNGEENV